MARPKTIFNPLNKTNSELRNKQIEKIDQAIAKETESEESSVSTSSVSTFFSSDLAQSVLSVHADVDVSEDLKAEPEKTIAELLGNNVVGISKPPKKSSKNKTNKTKVNQEEVLNEEKVEQKIEEIEIAQDNSQENNQDTK